MPKTEDFEYLLELPNVRAVDWDGDELEVRVCKKVSVDELDPDDNIENQVDVEFSVIDEHHVPNDNASYDLFSFRSNPQEHQKKIRPVKAGISEIHHSSTAATAGQYPAIVLDASKGVWDDDVERGDIVRTSNNHVYNLVGKAELGDEIIQPSPYDGGDIDKDVVGELVGYVPIENGVKADIAARSSNMEEYENDVMNYTDFSGKIFTGDYSDLRGKTIVKSGRTTGTTEGEMKMTGASVSVNMGGGEIVTFRDMMITDNMGAGGDSGSPAFCKQTNEFFGVLFAGSKVATIFCKVENIEQEFGIKYIGDRDDIDEDRVCNMCELWHEDLSQYLCWYC